MNNKKILPDMNCDEMIEILYRFKALTFELWIRKKIILEAVAPRNDSCNARI